MLWPNLNQLKVKRGFEKFKVIEEQLLKFQEDLQHAQKDNHKLNEDSSSHAH